MNSSTKHQILFLYNGAPLPAMLEMISYAQKQGLLPLLVLLDRGDRRLVIDSSLTDYEIIRIHVDYSTVESKRILSMPSQFRKIRSIITTELKSGGTIITSSLDMLFIARLATAFGDYEIRHQVRDLHELQLERGLVSSVLRFFERMLLKRVTRVIVSSPKFASEYYDELYSGEIVVLENVPQRAVWQGFKRTSRTEDVFTIGYIGVLRYKKSLYRLIDTVEKLVDEGFSIKVKFAGGGTAKTVADLKARITNHEIFTFSGPYEYSKDIKSLYADVDLIYAVYDESNRNCQIAMPNKFYESVLSAIPLLVAANTFVGDQTKRYGIGELVSIRHETNLYELLRAVFEPNSWHAQASDRLRSMSYERFYENFDIALSRSVL